MRELNLTAVGSSPLIADEIKSIIQSFLGEEIFISMKTTQEVADVEENIFYVCAKTQENFLREKIPVEKLFVFDLHPTTKFFLDIARIPAGAEVCVFNNLLPYTKLLAEECRALGVDKISFHSIAYDDMPAAEVHSRLHRAEYIIGVDRLLEHVLLKTYRADLRPDVEIIAGKRAASLNSAGKLLAGIAEFYRIALAEEKNPRVALDVGKRILKILKNASAKALIGQIGGNSSTTENFGGNATLDEQLSMMDYLREKFLRLGA